MKHSEPSSWNSDKDLSEINELHKTTFSAIERTNECTCFSFSRTFTLVLQEGRCLTQSSSPTSASFFPLLFPPFQMPKIPFHSHLSSVTLGFLPLPFLALEKLQIRNKVNSLAFQVQFILTTSTSPGQKKVKLFSMGIV